MLKIFGSNLAHIAYPAGKKEPHPGKRPGDFRNQRDTIMAKLMAVAVSANLTKKILFKDLVK